jgi:glucose-1-phosphate thymidylyltransferase
MIPIANQPILFYSLRNLAEAGVKDVAIILGPIQEGIRESVGDGADFGLRVEYIVQGEPRGLADAVLCAVDFLQQEPFVMYLGDNLLQAGVRPFLKQYEHTHPDAVVGATPVRHPESYGVVELSGDRIVSLEEKPGLPRSNLALIGVYLFGPEIHSVVRGLSPSKRGELEITDAIWGLCRTGRQVTVLRLEGWWKDTGRPSDLLEANELILGSMPAEKMRVQGQIAPGAHITGNVGIGAGSSIETGTWIEGPCVLGENVRVGTGTRIGPYSAIGNRVVLSRASVRRSILLEGAAINRVSLVDSLVGRNSEIVARYDLQNEVNLTVGDSSRILL